MRSISLTILQKDESTVQSAPNTRGLKCFSDSKPAPREGSKGSNWTLMFSACVGVGFKSKLIFCCDQKDYKIGEKARNGESWLKNWKINGEKYQMGILDKFYDEFKEKGWIQNGKLVGRVFQQVKE